MAWSDSRQVNLDASASAGMNQPPIELRAYNAPRPTIRSVIVLNQSSNTDVGICLQLAKSLPDFVVGAQFMSVIPVPATDSIVFVFSVPSGSRQTGRIFVSVTEESLAASSSVAPSSAVSSAFVTDISSVDSTSEIQ